MATAVEEVVYFAASDPAHGTELWRSDGTEAGTWRLTDACPGRCSSAPWEVRVLRGQLFFSADDGFSGRELWRSDGTSGGESRVRDICPGPCSSNPYELQEGPGGELLFFASAGRARQLWRTNGSRRGTVPIETVCTTLDWQFTCSYYLQRIGGLMLFVVSDALPTELWRSDGTAAGTRPLRELVPDLPAVTSLPVAVGGFALFWSQNGLWRTDGTSAVRIKALNDLTTPREYHQPLIRGVWNGLVFTTLDGGALVRSDGTPEGTFVVELFPDGSGVEDLIPLRDAALLLTSDGKGQALWRTQGTRETTEKVFSLRSAPNPTARRWIEDMVALGTGRAVFRIKHSADHLDETLEVWVTDATPRGTRRLEGVLSGSPSYPMMPAGDQVFFLRKSYYDARQLWRTDGTEAGTGLVKDFQEAPGSSGPLAQLAFGGGLLVSAQTSDTEAPLFHSDGTRAGTRVLSEEAGWGSGFRRVGDRVFFAAAEASIVPGLVNRSFAAKGLWSTDGTEAGTSQVSDEVYAYRPLATFHRQLFFSAGLGIVGPFGGVDVELWKSDGTGRGTRNVKNINPYFFDTGFHHICYGAPSNPGPGVVLADRLFFAADDGRFGRELWRTDGTRAGTRLFFDVNPRRSPELPPACSDGDDGRRDTGLSSNPEELLRFHGGALFAADDGETGRELWWTDGIPAGTRRVEDLQPGPAGSAPHGLTRFGDAVFFFASATGNGEGLWRTDGTAAGTFLVHPLAVRGMPSWAWSPRVVGDGLFFVVYNETTGPELWTSQGDAPSTRLVVDLRPGPSGSYPQELVDAGGVLVFAATDGETGLEPWRSDGTAAGTYPLGDLNRGPDASSPGPFTRIGDTLFTGAWEPVHGRELWAIPLSKN
ncbi:MAG TPA: ELWxxDGT repeat protein [Thermoanaerobaculia bacterium]